MSGKLIVFEGIDGSGKGTQLDRLAAQLEAEGNRVYLTREPSEGPIGKLLRAGLRGEENFDEATLALLFAADRLDHLHDVQAHIEAGDIVLCDRYILSSLAYNSQGLSLEWVLSLNAEADKRLHPDLTLLFDLHEQEALARIEARGEQLERYETLHQLYQVRQMYLMISEVRLDDKVTRIDANRNPDAIAEDVWQTVQTIL